MFESAGAGVEGAGVFAEAVVVADIGASLFGELEEFGEFFGVFGREVGGFADVFLEVEEEVFCEGFGVFGGDVIAPFRGGAFGAFFVFEHDLPIAIADGAEVVVLVVEVGAVEFVLLAVPDVGDVEAVEGAVGGDLGSGEGGEGGHEVDGGGEEVVGGAGGDAAGGADDC